MARTRVRVREGAVRQVASGQRAQQFMLRTMLPVQHKARILAPASPNGSHGRAAGYLRRMITLTVRNGRNGAYARLSTEARTPKGFPYGALQNKRKPYIQPALRGR